MFFMQTRPPPGGEKEAAMFLDDVDPLDLKILSLLIENARYTYSEIGQRLGISRVAVKNHMNDLEKRGIIENYTAVINPRRMSSAVSCYFEIETTPDRFPAVTQALQRCPTVTQIYRTTGSCHLHVHAVAAGQQELEDFLRDVIDPLPGVTSIRTNVILDRIKDIKGLRL